MAKVPAARPPDEAERGGRVPVGQRDRVPEARAAPGGPERTAAGERRRRAVRGSVGPPSVSLLAPALRFRGTRIDDGSTGSVRFSGIFSLPGGADFGFPASGDVVEGTITGAASSS